MKFVMYVTAILAVIFGILGLASKSWLFLGFAVFELFIFLSAAGIKAAREEEKEDPEYGGYDSFYK